MNVGPLFADPAARQLYAEIASIEEQHVTQYESLLDPTETWIEKWMLHEANECYNYYRCIASETNHEVKAIWERFLDYELGHFHAAAESFQRYERRDPAEIVTGPIPRAIEFQSQREFYRQVLVHEVDLRALGTRFVPQDQESRATLEYRTQLNSDGSPSLAVSSGYVWAPGTEIVTRGAVSGPAAAMGMATAALSPAGSRLFTH